MAREPCTVEETVALNDLLLDVVDATMKQVFAEAGADAIYGFLRNNSHLKREDIAGKPEVFSAGLERLLGSGATMLQKLILKNLHFKLGLKFEENEGYGFSDYVEDLRRRFEE